MKTKTDILKEMLNYCGRGNCYKCRGCAVTNRCMMDVYYATTLCSCPCNDTCWSMVAVAHRMIDEGEY